MSPAPPATTSLHGKMSHRNVWTAKRSKPNIRPFTRSMPARAATGASPSKLYEHKEVLHHGQHQTEIPSCHQGSDPAGGACRKGTGQSCPGTERLCRPQWQYPGPDPGKPQGAALDLPDV